MDYAASVSPNPSSIHIYGVEARAKLENARKSVTHILGARPEEIIFTSGGTESNNIAIQGVALAKISPHIVTTNIEHPSVLDTFRLLEKRNLAEITIIPVEANGTVDSKKIKKAFKNNTVLVSVMYANNEIGTVQPIREITKEIRHWNKLNPNKILFHTDAVQAVNYLDLNVEKLGVDLLSLSGSKIKNAGKVGVLYKKKNVKLENIYGGGDQEQGIRPGTENLSEIIKFATALESAQKIKNKESKRLTVLRDYFVKKLQSFNVIVNGDLQNRLPNNINVTFPKIPSDLLVIELSAKGIMCSSKSACKSSRAEGSYVIKAIHPEIDSEIGGVRFSLGRDTSKADIDYTIKSLKHILTKLKTWYY